MKTENDRIQPGGDGLAVDTVAAWESTGKFTRESTGSRQTVVEQSPRGRIISLAQMLVDAGILTADELAAAQETAWQERQSLGRVLVLSRDLATLTAINLGLAMVGLRSETIERQAVVQVPEEVARKYMVLPLSKTGNRLTEAMTDPADRQVLQDLAARTGCSIDPVITTEEDIKEHIDREYRLTAQPLTA